MVNPFNPGAGRRPPYLAGREKLLASLRSDMNSVYSGASGLRPIVISGLRGMGKTVLAQALATEAKQQGWVVIWAEASNGDSLAKKLSQSIYVELRRLKSACGNPAIFEHALAVLKSFQMKIDPAGSVSFGIDVTPAKGFADSGDLSLDLTDVLQALGQAAREAGTAVFICIDELQEAPKVDLEALNVALHSIGQAFDPVPVYFVGIGLPTLPATLAEASSYAERLYRFYILEGLNTQDSKAAFVEPVLDFDMHWTPEALDVAMEMAQGYPYFIQQCGYSICEQVAPGATIDMPEAVAGVAIAREELENGIYKSRWDRVTPACRQFLRAMAAQSQPAKIVDVAAEMGKSGAGELSVTRERLINDGVIYAPQRGYVAFTIPGMDAYINSQPE